MSSDELSSPARKRCWKWWIVALACVGAVTTIALLTRTPKDRSGAIWFVGFTNYDGQKRLVFQGTNGIPGQKFLAVLGIGSIPQSKDSSRLPPFQDAATGSASPGTNLCFTLKVPANGAPYYVAWYYYDSPPRRTGWGRVRGGCYKFLREHGMPGPAELFAVKPEMHYILSTELKE